MSGECKNCLLPVGVGNLAYELGPGHIHGTVDRAGLGSRIVLEDFHHQGRVVRENDADLQRGKYAGELRSETEPELLNDAIFGAIYYRLLLRSGPLTRRFGEELVEQVLRGQRGA